MGETLTFRTPMARVLTIGVAVVAVVALVYFVSDGGIREAWRSGPTVLCIVVVTWALFWRPQVQVSDGGVTVANILRTVHVPWPVLRSVDSKWSLTVTGEDVTVRRSRPAAGWPLAPADRAPGAARMHRARCAAPGTPMPRRWRSPSGVPPSPMPGI